MPPGSLHRLVPVRPQVLQGQGPNEKLGDELSLRHKNMQTVPSVQVLCGTEATVSVGRMTFWVTRVGHDCLIASNKPTRNGPNCLRGFILFVDQSYFEVDEFVPTTQRLPKISIAEQFIIVPDIFGKGKTWQRLSKLLLMF